MRELLLLLLEDEIQRVVLWSAPLKADRGSSLPVSVSDKNG